MTETYPEDEFPMPSWAVAKTPGHYVLGAHLPTRDGRRHGNAHIVEILQSPTHGVVYRCLTDAGMYILYDRAELDEGYYPPEWVSGVQEVVSRFDLNIRAAIEQRLKDAEAALEQLRSGGTVVGFVRAQELPNARPDFITDLLYRSSALPESEYQPLYTANPPAIPERETLQWLVNMGEDGSLFDGCDGVRGWQTNMLQHAIGALRDLLSCAAAPAQESE
jgi:hypothetical protein